MNHASLWRLAVPMILCNTSTALLGLVDTAVVGHLQEVYYLGAIAIGAVIFNFIYWGMGFLRMSITGLTAQAYGRRDYDACRSLLALSLLLAFCIAILLLVLQRDVLSFSLWFLQGSDEVRHYAGIYFQWLIWGAPAVLSCLVLNGWLLGMQNAKAVLYVLVATNLLNVVLDLLFVFVFDMDVRGVALASVIALYFGLLLACILVRSELRRHQGRWLSSSILNLQHFKKIFFLQQNIFIRTICLIFVFAFFTRQGAKQGDVILAANAILLNFQLLLALLMDGLANAVEALIGKAKGAADRAMFIDHIKTVSLWSCVVAIMVSLFYFAAGRAIIDLLTDLPSIRFEAYRYLPWLILSPVVAVWCFVLDGVFVGLMLAREMRDTMLLSVIVIFLPLWFILQPLGNHGLWLAFMIFFIARGVTLLYTALRIERGDGLVPLIS